MFAFLYPQPAAGMLIFDEGPPPWGQESGTEKRKPHYDLARIKAVFADAGSLNRTYSSLQGVDALDMDDAAVVAVIQALALRTSTSR